MFHAKIIVENHRKTWVQGYTIILIINVDFLPSPPGAREGPLRMLLFDSWYDHYRGVICLVAVIDGSVGVGEYNIYHYHRLHNQPHPPPPSPQLFTVVGDNKKLGRAWGQG